MSSETPFGLDGLDVDVHLLADVERDRRLVGQGVDDLEDPGVDPLGVVAGQALLGDHVGLDLDELERRSRTPGRPLRVATASGLGVEQGDVVLVDVDPDVEPVDVAEDDQGLVPDRARRTGRAGR